MERRDLILAALAAAGENASFTPVQVQKFFFLIDRKAAAALGGPHFAFAPYDYGPFDKAVYEELDTLQTDGLVDIGNTSRYRQYCLTAAGYRQGSLVLHNLHPPAKSFLGQTANWVRALNFQQLVAAIYKHYPDMKVNSVFRA